MLKSLLSLSALLGAAAAMPNPVEQPQASGTIETPDIAAITSVPQSSFTSYQKGGLIRGTDAVAEGTVAKRWTCSTSAIFTWGDTDNGGKGVQITNAASDWAGFYVYHNSCENMPYKYIWIAAGDTKFISLPDQFQGRIERGVDAYNLNGQPQLLATWLELTYDPSGVAWGDVSLIRGCDGASLIWSLDGSGAWKGFTQWILDGAPYGAYDMKNDGQWVLKYTENLDGSINTIPRDWYMQKVGADLVFVDDSHGWPVISTSNGRFGTYWPSGRP